MAEGTDETTETTRGRSISLEQIRTELAKRSDGLSSLTPDQLTAILKNPDHPQHAAARQFDRELSQAIASAFQQTDAVRKMRESVSKLAQSLAPPRADLSATLTPLRRQSDDSAELVKAISGDLADRGAREAKRDSYARETAEAVISVAAVLADEARRTANRDAASEVEAERTKRMEWAILFVSIASVVVGVLAIIIAS